MPAPPGLTGLIARYRDRLPVTERTPVVSLGEGQTPLIPAPRLAASLGLGEASVWLKLEGCNPTGSFKDRGMTVAVSKALEEGSRGLVCASTGNTAASAAAYAARAGLPCFVVLPAGAVAAGKLAQAVAHGARVIALRGGFDQALALVRETAAERGLTTVNSTNPYRLQGQKTAAFEVASALGRAPDWQFLPVGNAGNICAYWSGYKEEDERSRCGRPRLMGFQAAGADPLVRGRPVPSPRTVASAIRIGNPASWKAAIAAKDESGGSIGRVTDKEILSAYKELARMEGVFCEPSSAAGVAGLIQQARCGLFKASDRDSLRVVCILTGHGLKDPESARALGRGAFRAVAATAAALRKELGRR